MITPERGGECCGDPDSVAESDSSVGTWACLGLVSAVKMSL